MHTKRQVLRRTRSAPLALAGVDWRGRLRTLVHQPKQVEVKAFLQHSVRPALAEVAAELQAQGLTASVDKGEDEDGRVWLKVGHGEEMDFFYSVRPQPYQPPAFVLEDPRRQRDRATNFYRAEVHLREGGQDYDVMGWRKQDVIHDVLDQYHRHLHFLDTVRSAMRDPAWQGIAVLEGYIFAALVYAVFSYGMGSYSRFIERRLKTDHSHGRNA